MLTLTDGTPGTSFCDGIRRRNFLKAGFLGLGSLSLADVLRLRAAAAETGQPVRNTSVIFIELAGGPSQFETYDPKPSAPQEYRGPFSSIQTTLAGERFCELLPEQAKLLDKLTIIRSIRHDKNSHDPSSHLTQTGYYKRGPKGGPNEMPSFGSVIAKVRGSNHPSLPAYVSIPRVMRNGGASHLGKSCEPFATGGDPNHPKFRVRNLSLARGLDLSRLDSRKELLTSLDTQRQLIDLEGATAAHDDFVKQAYNIVAGPRTRLAFDIHQEDDRLRDSYGRNSVGQSLLLARRLVEMGVSCATVRVGGWDDHNKMVRKIEPRAQAYDQGMAALVRDLYERGLQQDVLVVAMGEFGRTPRFNRNAGRDHWGALMSVALAGGNLPPGILGTSNSKGEVPLTAVYRPENVLAVMYRHLGIDPGMTFDDFAGRPRHVLEERGVIRELVDA
jgi:hypothetical protein